MIRPPAQLWGVEAGIEPLRGGHRNAVFRTTGLATDLVFKSSRRSPEAIDWLTAVQGFAAESGFVVPDTVRSADGKLLDGGWTCETFIPGRPLLPHELPSILPNLDRFHRLTRDVGQRPGFLAAEDLLDRPAGGDVDLSAMPEDVAAECRAAWRSLRGRGRSAIHGDVRASNLIRCGDGRVALIDWDEARVDVPVFDLAQVHELDREQHRAVLAWEVACSWQLEPAYARETWRRMRGL